MKLEIESVNTGRIILSLNNLIVMRRPQNTGDLIVAIGNTDVRIHITKTTELELAALHDIWQRNMPDTAYRPNRGGFVRYALAAPLDKDFIVRLVNDFIVTAKVRFA
jgi:hypothetical protein